ncbi:SGNH/GDSL hydrolase family protein [Lacticaseibacillus jixiensis]|uniref:SGNH/GDSL hydrolase family protein n=1 Tax=Lacticaseibacillus jixiensis TaxID=3231926 RepID=UPI0036F3374C
MKTKLLATTLAAATAAVLVKQGKLHRPNLHQIAGNAPIWHPALCQLDPHAPLYGKQVLWLGSSITEGSGAKGVAMSDYLMAQDGLIATKQAVSGTALAGPEVNSYYVRLIEQVPPATPYDCAVVQLSTNDIRMNKPLGHITDAAKQQAFNTETTLGALEAILAYIQNTWACPVLIYSCIHPADHDYAALTAAMVPLQHKWQFTFLDLNHNAALNAATHANPLAMADDIHPTQLGYRNLWTPLFRQALEQMLI